MKPQVADALAAEMSRPKATAPDFDHLRLDRGVLRTLDGDIPVKRIGKGAFATVYREQAGAKRVFAFTGDETYDKEIATQATIPGNPHLPAVESYGSTATEKVYVMPFYKTPFKKADSPQGWADYVAAKKCLKEAMAKRDWGYPANFETVECAKKRAISPAVVEALESLMSTAANYGSDYAFEFAPRNLATDEAGNLVLLDAVYSRDAMMKIAKAEQKAAEAKARATRGW